MQIIKNVPLLRRLFENLQIIVQNKTLPTQQRITAISILSESAFHEYKNCDEIINMAYAELISVIENEAEDVNFRVEAILVMLLLFAYYASRLPEDKRLIKENVYDLCFNKMEYFLDNEYSNTKGWLSSIEFLIRSQKEFPYKLMYGEIFKKYNFQLFSIAYDKNQAIINRIFSIGLLFDAMYRHRLQGYSDKELEQKISEKKSHCDPQFRVTIMKCFDLLYGMANDEKLNTLDRLKAIEVILNFIYFEADMVKKMFRPCFEILLDLLVNYDSSETLIQISILLFNEYAANKNFEMIGKECIQAILKITIDKDEKYLTRVQGIKFIIFNKNTCGFSKKNLLTIVSESLVDIVLTGEVASEGYLEAVKLYFDTMYRHEKKIPAVSPKPVSRNDPCPCASGKKYKKCCLNKEELSLQHSMKEYNELIKLDPNCASTFYDRGLIKHLLGQYREAIQDYDRAIALDPNYSYAFNNRGLSKKQLGLHQAAIEDFNQAIALDSSYPETFANRGGAKCQLGEYKSAIEDFDRVLVLKPNHLEVINARRVAKFMLKPAPAVKTCEEI